MPLPALLPRHILDLADVAISGQLSDIVGLPPPPDYVDSMLPYNRYQIALRDVHDMAKAMQLLVTREPEFAQLDDLQRLNLIVHNAVLLRGQASGLLDHPVMSRRRIMELNIGSVFAWADQQKRSLDSGGPIGALERMVLDAVAYTSIRFFKIYAETDTDTVLFTPEVSRFVMLARYCDWPVIEYQDGELEVFFCDPIPDPQPIVGQAITVYEITKILRRLLVDECHGHRDAAWKLSLWHEPVIDLFGVRPEQIAA